VGSEHKYERTISKKMVDENGKLLPKEVRDNTLLANPHKPSPTMSPTKLQNFLAQDNIQNFFGTLAKKTFSEENNVRLRSKNVLENRELYISEVNNYFDLCYSNHVIPTMSSLVAYIGVNMDAFYEYANDCTRSNYDIVKKTIEQCHAVNEVAALNGTIDARLFTFLAKNYYGLKDITSLDIHPSDNTTPNSDETYNAIKQQIIIEGESIEK